jgi:hypothetical protein
MSHPVGTLQRWFSSHPAPCTGLPLRAKWAMRVMWAMGWRIVARGPRSWRSCAATRRLAPASIPA